MFKVMGENWSGNTWEEFEGTYEECINYGKERTFSFDPEEDEILFMIDEKGKRVCEFYWEYDKDEGQCRFGDFIENYGL